MGPIIARQRQRDPENGFRVIMAHLSALSSTLVLSGSGTLCLAFRRHPRDLQPRPPGPLRQGLPSVGLRQTLDSADRADVLRLHREGDDGIRDIRRRAGIVFSEVLRNRKKRHKRDRVEKRGLTYSKKRRRNQRIRDKFRKIIIQGLETGKTVFLF